MPKDNPRNRLSADPHRPQYHFLPPANWMNDPNGLIQWKGQIHLFYQYNPHGAFHGTIHWGHAVSRDLVHWQDQPIALAPTPGNPDEGGCWSGCAVDDNGLPTLVYTGIHPQVVCLATSSDGLIHWEKYPGNPVIDGPPPDLRPLAGGQFRDPFVWKEGKRWYMVIGSMQEGAGGMVLLYRSEDLRRWEYLHPLLVGDIHQTGQLWTGSMWECPNFFPLENRHVLIVSHQAPENVLMYPSYYVGEYRELRFYPEVHDILVRGEFFYAPQVLQLRDGRQVLWGWIVEGRRANATLEAGWAGVMSLPLQVSLAPDRRLILRPVEELQSLRRQHWDFENLDLIPGGGGFTGEAGGDCLEILAEFEPDAEAEFGLKVRCSPDGEEQTRIVYQSERKRLLIEPERSSLSTVVDRDIRKAPVELDENGRLRIHIFLDRSVLEIFANDKTCLVGRIYPTRPDSQNLELFVRRGRARLVRMDVWRLASIWEQRDQE
jgi:beta-fructofuranosidase